MKVKDVILNALKLLGRNELAEALENGAALSNDGEETVKTLLYCYNSVEDELSRNGFPIVAQEQLVSVSGRFYLDRLSFPAIKVLSVKSGGAEIKYVLQPPYLLADAVFIDVTYTRPPEIKTIGGETSYGEEIGGRTLAYGTAAEYCLINGETSAADLWEARYRAEISVIKRGVHGSEIPPRRWV